MLEDIMRCPKDICNLVIYCRSANMEKFVTDFFKKVYGVNRDTFVWVDNAKDFKEVRSDTANFPFSGDRWLVVYNTEKVKSMKDLTYALTSLAPSRCVLFFVKDYKVFLQLKSEAEKQSRYSKVVYANRLTKSDIVMLHNLQVPEGNRLPRELLSKVSKEYQYNVDAALEINSLLNQGKSFGSMKDIIRAVGLGRNSVNDLLLVMLRSKARTIQGKKTLAKKLLFQFDDLSESIKPSSIVNYMLSSLRSMVGLKELQQLGKYTTIHGFLPGISENYDLEAISRLGFALPIVADEIPTVKIVGLANLIQDMKQANPFVDSRTLFVMIVYAFLAESELYVVNSKVGL